MAERNWGRDTERTEVSGHPCLVYRHRPRPVAALLHDAQRWNGRVFIVEGARRITYDAFASAVGRVAARLAERGVTRGDRVVLLAYNSVEWLAAFWALQSIGADTLRESMHDNAMKARDIAGALGAAWPRARRWKVDELNSTGFALAAEPSPAASLSRLTRLVAPSAPPKPIAQTPPPMIEAFDANVQQRAEKKLMNL